MTAPEGRWTPWMWSLSRACPGVPRVAAVTMRRSRHSRGGPCNERTGHAAALPDERLVDAVADRGRVRSGQPGGRHGLRRHALGCRTVPGIAGRLRAGRRTDHRCGGGHGPARAVFTGVLADRSGRYWSLTILGYAMTAVCVPLLALAPFVGVLGLGLAAMLIVGDRAGKAIRSPSKSALLAALRSRWAAGGGSPYTRRSTRSEPSPARCWSPGWSPLPARRGQRSCPGSPGRCVHAAALHPQAPHGRRPARDRTVADPAAVDASPATKTSWNHGRCPRTSTRSPLMRAGHPGVDDLRGHLYHLVDAGLVETAVVPLVDAAAMAVEAVAALGMGFAYDRRGPAILSTLPVVIVAVPTLALASTLTLVLAGVLLWACGDRGAGLHGQGAGRRPGPESRLATAYGVFAAFQGLAALAGGTWPEALHHPSHAAHRRGGRQPARLRRSCSSWPFAGGRVVRAGPDRVPIQRPTIQNQGVDER